EDKAAGKVGLTLTTTGIGNCLAVNSNTIININPAPTVTVGEDITICSDALDIPLLATFKIAGGVAWTSSGTGTFNGINTARSFYLPTANDRKAGIVNLTATTTGNGNCQPVNDKLVLIFTPTPTVNAGIDQTICADLGTIDLQGKVTVASGGTWASLGTGRFNPDEKLLNTAYAISPEDTTAKKIRFILTTTGNGTCRPVKDTIDFKINPSPVVIASAASVCANVNAPVQLTGKIGNAKNARWSTTGSGAFAPTATALSPLYYPSENDKAAGVVKLTFTSEDAGTCKPVASTVNLIIAPIPKAEAGIDQLICRGTQTTLSAKTYENLQYSWLTTNKVNIATTSQVQVTARRDTSFVLKVTDIKGCTSGDTVRVRVVDPPKFNLQDHFCFQAPLTLNSNPSTNGTGTYQWFRNDTILFGKNTNKLLVEKSGKHKISYNIGSCTVYDTAKVTDLPVLKGLDKITCIGLETMLKTTKFAKAKYQWYNEKNVVINGATADSIKVIAAILPRDTIKYFVSVTDSLGCINRDTLGVISLPPPALNLVNPINACLGNEVLLDGKPSNIEVSGKEKVIWSRDGKKLADTTLAINVKLPGYYKILYKIGECGAADSTLLSFLDPPKTLMNDTAKFCLELDGKVSIDAGPGYAYLWQEDNGDKKDKTIDVSTPGYHYVQIYNEGNCFTVDSIYVKDVCPPRLFVPDAFSPGIEGPDKYFRVFGAYFANFKITIFNRWGEIIYYSEDPNFRWDGFYRDDIMPNGVYTYIITYGALYQEFKDDKKKVGSVIIVR
ncbi:MAG TPA: gliding motility-associated C-terminal domain-containing protein, partial [Cytophagaceae bacterium]